MAKRWIQIVTAALCIASACASSTTQPATNHAAGQPPVKPAVTQPITEKHEPVAPPPPPAAPAVVVQPPPAVRVPSTQPVITPPPPPVFAATQPGPIDDRVAYGIGYSAGRRIHDRLSEDGRTANDLEVIKGVIDGLSNADPAYPRDKVIEAVADFEAYTQQRRAEKLYAENPSFRKHADENLQKSRALLDQNAEMAGVDVRPDGVQVQTIAIGNGHVVDNVKTLSFKNLRVSLADGTLVKSSDGDHVVKVPVGDVLPAVVDAIRDMKAGSKCKIWLPPDKAYGLAGKAPVIGPNQAIEYEFELVGSE